MASIRKKSGKWQVQIRRQGFPQISKTFARKADAVEWARSMDAKADRVELPPNRRILDAVTLQELVERYREEVVTMKRGGANEAIMINAFLRDPICKKSLSKIGDRDWAAYRDKRLQKITAKSLKRELSPISNMFTVAAAEWGFEALSNPISRLKITATDNKRTRRLSKFEELKLLNTAKEMRVSYLEPLIMLALETGMRRGELLRILDSHIDFRRRLLVVPETKNGYSRTIPLSLKAVKILTARQVEADEGGRLFPVSENAVRLSWARVCSRTGLHDLHFHDLRHEAISRLFEMGLTTPEVAMISGHKDIRMLFRYAHANQTSILKKLDAG